MLYIYLDPLYKKRFDSNSDNNNNDKLLTPRFSPIGPEHNNNIIQISIIDEGAGISPVS